MTTGASSAPVLAEIRRLARLLEREAHDLAYLESVALEDLRALREQTTEVLWRANSATFGRLAAASKLLPNSVTATISERAFGPLLSARMAAVLDPKRAADVAGKLSAPFLADLAVELDPRRASVLISLIEPNQIAEITRELDARREYVAMGRFVGHLSDPALEAAIGVMSAPTMLHVGFVLEDKQRVQRLIELLPHRRMDEIIGAAAEYDLWLEALDLLGHLTLERQAEIVASAPELDDAARDALAATVIEHGLADQAAMIADRDPALRAELARRGPLP